MSFPTCFLLLEVRKRFLLFPSFFYLSFFPLALWPLIAPFLFRLTWFSAFFCIYFLSSFPSDPLLPFPLYQPNWVGILLSLFFVFFFPNNMSICWGWSIFLTFCSSYALFCVLRFGSFLHWVLWYITPLRFTDYRCIVDCRGRERGRVRDWNQGRQRRSQFNGRQSRWATTTPTKGSVA